MTQIKFSLNYGSVLLCLICVDLWLVRLWLEKKGRLIGLLTHQLQPSVGQAGHKDGALVDVQRLRFLLISGC